MLRRLRGCLNVAALEDVYEDDASVHLVRAWLGCLQGRLDQQTSLAVGQCRQWEGGTLGLQEALPHLRVHARARVGFAGADLPAPATLTQCHAHSHLWPCRCWSGARAASYTTASARRTTLVSFGGRLVEWKELGSQQGCWLAAAAALGRSGAV